MHKVPLFLKVHDLFASRERKLESFFEWNFNLKIYKQIFKKSDVILIQSPEMRDLMQKYGLLFRNKTYILPNTISKVAKKIGESLSRKYKDYIRSIIPHLDATGIKMLWIGRIYKDRGLHDLLIELKKIKYKLDYHMIIIGESMDINLRKILNDLKIGNKIFYIDKMDNRLILPLIKDVDLCIGPLKAGVHTIGAVPRKILEYYIFEKAVIAHRFSATKLLLNDKTALVFRSTNELREILINLDNIDLGEYGKEAYRVLNKYFITEKYVNMLKSLLESHSSM